MAIAEQYGNDQLTEELWAFKAMEHAEVYFNLISSVNPSTLKLTPHDNEIYNEFKKDFPKINPAVFTVDDLKSENAKSRWRPFCNHFEDTLKDFNFGTLLRLDCAKDYSEDNTIVVPRVKFLAIEIARNRAGLNQNIFENNKLKQKNCTDS